MLSISKEVVLFFLSYTQIVNESFSVEKACQAVNDRLDNVFCRTRFDVVGEFLPWDSTIRRMALLKLRTMSTSEAIDLII